MCLTNDLENLIMGDKLTIQLEGGIVREGTCTMNDPYHCTITTAMSGMCKTFNYESVMYTHRKMPELTKSMSLDFDLINPTKKKKNHNTKPEINTQKVWRKF